MPEESVRIAALRDRLEGAILEAAPTIKRNGNLENRLAGNSSLTVPGIDAEALIVNTPELAISTGSACTSGAPEPSHVLLAIGLGRAEASSTIRIGVGRFNTEEEMGHAADVMAVAYERLARMQVQRTLDGQINAVRRLAHLGGWNEVGGRHDRLALTPNENAAATLGALPNSLEGPAREVLGEERSAHPITVQRLLKQAEGEALDSADPEDVARTLLPPIRELFRAGANLGADPGSARARRVLGVARFYRSRLRAQGLVDPAEVLWEAAAVQPQRRPVLVWGYPRFGRDEVAFIDQVAGEGSTVHLPHADDGLFVENLETAEAFRRRGWTVERDAAGAVWDVGARVEATEYAEGVALLKVREVH